MCQINETTNIELSVCDGTPSTDNFRFRMSNVEYTRSLASSSVFKISRRSIKPLNFNGLYWIFEILDDIWRHWSKIDFSMKMLNWIEYQIWGIIIFFLSLRKIEISSAFSVATLNNKFKAYGKKKSWQTKSAS